MNVWRERFPGRKTIPVLEKFNASIGSDCFLAEYEIESSKAYAKALRLAGVLNEVEEKTILRGLEEVRRQITQGADLSTYEDIHSAVELMLTEEIGESGKKLHSGRSRNEQVVCVERLYLKEKIKAGISAVKDIQQVILALAADHPDTLMPGYTHLQPAQCLLFSHFVLAVFWQLQRGRERLAQALERTDASPLGSGALCGSSVPLDRDFLARELGFSRVSDNSLDTVADRSFILDGLFAFAMILLDLSRFFEDLTVFSSREFGFFILDDCIATSSSLMPQKKNPDFFELLRSKAGSTYGRLTELFITLKGLPMSYCKDLQLDKGALFLGIEDALESLLVCAVVLGQIKPNAIRMAAALTPELLAVDLVDYLTGKGVPFRKAHGIVGAIAAHLQESGKDLLSMGVTDLRRFSQAFSEDVKMVFDFTRSLSLRRTSGSTAPRAVNEQLRRARSLMQAD